MPINPAFLALGGANPGLFPLAFTRRRPAPPFYVPPRIEVPFALPGSRPPPEPGSIEADMLSVLEGLHELRR